MSAWDFFEVIIFPLIATILIVCMLMVAINSVSQNANTITCESQGFESVTIKHATWTGKFYSTNPVKYCLLNGSKILESDLQQR